jgi:hypothetical protein
MFLCLSPAQDHWPNICLCPHTGQTPGLGFNKAIERSPKMTTLRALLSTACLLIGVVTLANYLDVNAKFSREVAEDESIPLPKENRIFG